MNRYPYRRHDDLICMQALLLATRSVGSLADFPSAENLAGLLEQPTVRSRTSVWWDGGRLVAYALIIQDRLYVETLPEIDLTLEIEAWAGQQGDEQLKGAAWFAPLR